MRRRACIGAILVAMAAAAADAQWSVDAPPALREPVQRAVTAARDDRLVAAYSAARDAGYPWARCAIDSTRRRVVVESGPQAIVGELAIVGVDSVRGAEFARLLRLRRGDPWTRAAWRGAVSGALARLGERGHAFATASLQSVSGDPETGFVDLVVWVAPGEPLRLRGARVRGATHTDPEVLARLAGVGAGERFRESELRRVAERLEARAVVDEVLAVRPVPDETGRAVWLDIELRQRRHTGSVQGAFGLVREREGEGSRVSGAVDLELLDLFGTARQFAGSWLDDGRDRRRLDLRYREPLIFGSPLDLSVALGQRHRDDQFDTVLAELELHLAFAGSRELTVGGGWDRTTFVGELARVRRRLRVRAELALRHRRDERRGWFGAFVSSLEAAQVRESGEGGLPEPPSQSIGRASLLGGYAFGERWAAQTRWTGATIETDELPLPESEWMRVGGATTVRGYAEEQFAAERFAVAASELVIGPSDGGRAYLFLDVGWLRLTRSDDVDERWLRGFGVGLRSPLPVGSLDLSLGFAEELRFETGKLHLVLRQEF